MARGNTRLARQLLWFAAFADIALLLMMCPLIANGGAAFGLILGLVVNASIGVYSLKQGILFELKQERIWNGICLGIGYSAEARSYRNGVRGAMRGDTKTIYPKLREIHGTPDAWIGIVRPFAGQTIDHYTKYAENFAFGFNVPSVTFEVAPNGLLIIMAGDVPIPEAFDHPGALNGHQAATQPALPQPVYAHNANKRTAVIDEAFDEYIMELLYGVPVARDVYGREKYLPIIGQHWLVAAQTGGGKSSFLWSLVLGLAPAWHDAQVVFWGCDPKRLELAIGRKWWDEYADNDEDIVKLLEKCVADMMQRTSELQGKYRKFTPSMDTPLNVIVIDELGYLSAMMPDRKLRTRAEQAISTLLMLGRAVGYSVVGAVQDPRKETVGFRDLFPIRIAGVLPEPMVDLVLGEGMYDAGAYCDRIPLGDAGAGCAYVRDEFSNKPLLVRAAWCSDDAIRSQIQ